MAELGTSVLPGSVVASHLEASAAGLAAGTADRRVDLCVGTVGELSAIVDHLVAGQRHLAVAIGQLATHIGRRDGDLSDVLTAAAEAAGYSAQALAEAGPLLQVVLDATGADAPLP